MTIIDAYKSSRFVSFVLKLFGCIRLDKEKPRSAIRRALKLLFQKQVIGIFPEGIRSPDGQLMAFENGVNLILSHYNKENNNALPVLPVVILGTFRPGSGIRSWFEKAGKFFRRQYHIKVVFGEPIHDELENRYHTLYDSVKTQYSEASI